MWFTHLQKSPYCHAHYSILCDNKGRDVCQCGWVNPNLPTPEPRGMTFGELLAKRKGK